MIATKRRLNRHLVAQAVAHLPIPAGIGLANSQLMRRQNGNRAILTSATVWRQNAAAQVPLLKPTSLYAP